VKTLLFEVIIYGIIFTVIIGILMSVVAVWVTAGEISWDTEAESYIDNGIVVIIIDDREVPLFSSSSDKLVWAISNLFLCVAGVLIAVVAAIHAIAKKQCGHEESVGLTEEGVMSDEEIRKGAEKRLLWLVASNILALVGLCLFIITQDVTRTMVLIDEWTVFSAALFLLQVLCFAIAAKRKKEVEHTMNEANVIKSRN